MSVAPYQARCSCGFKRSVRYEADAHMTLKNHLLDRHGKDGQMVAVWVERPLPLKG